MKPEVGESRMAPSTSYNGWKLYCSTVWAGQSSGQIYPGTRAFVTEIHRNGLQSLCGAHSGFLSQHWFKGVPILVCCILRICIFVPIGSEFVSVPFLAQQFSL